MLASVAPNVFGQAVSATPPAGAGVPADDATIVLSPFVVEAAEDANSYQATATLAGTRIRTELRDVGSAISVVTAQFLQDTAARNTQDLLVYTTNTEVGGLSGNFLGTGGRSDTTEQRVRPQTNTRVRGLTNADNTRDFFLTDIPWDSYNVGRVDLQRGPNAILFGIGSPAGIVNASLNGASFRDSNTLEFRYGSYGSYRGSIDINKVLLPDELAIRVSGLNDKTFYRQKPAYNHDTRGYAALRYDPSLFATGRNRLSLRANYEKGDIDANRPRVTPPIDAITPWFSALQKRTYSAQTIGETDPAIVLADTTGTAGAVQGNLAGGIPNPNATPWLGNGAGGQVFDEVTGFFNSPVSRTNNGFFEPSMSDVNQLPEGVAFPWTMYAGIRNFSRAASQAGLRGSQIGALRDFTVNDARIFDFYNKLIDGPNKKEIQDFEAANIALAYTALDNRVGVEVTYDKQKYHDEVNQIFGGNPWLTVDVMNTYPDGRPNENVGRAMIVGSPNANNGRWTDRRALRATAFAELNFRDFMDESPLRSFLGRHVFTGLYMDQRVDTDTRSWYSFVHSPTYRTTQSPQIDSRRIPTLHYLSGSLAGVELSSANIDRLYASQMPTNNPILDFNPGVRPGATAPYTRDDIIGWQQHNVEVLNGFTGRDRNLMYGNAGKFRDDVESTALVWQAFLFDGILVPTVGWRRDKAENFNAGDAYTRADSSRIVDHPDWTLPTGADDPRLGTRNRRYNSESGRSTSWSVVAHTPRRWKERAPMQSEISLFYNRSDNFQPAGGRTDVFGRSIASPTGKTEDYGFTITTLNDRLTLKVNWYETSVQNQSLDGGGVGNLQNVYMVGFGEHWGRMFAHWATLGIEGFNNNYARVDPQDPTSPLIDPSVTLLRYEPAPGETVAQALQRQNNAITTLLGSPPPQEFAQHWNIALNQDWSQGWGGYASPNQPGSLAVTGDTYSEGIEYEILAQPTRNWNISFNASKTRAQRSNLAESFATWVEERNAFYSGPAGDVQLWGPTWGQETVRFKFRNEFYGSYQLYRLLEDSDVPELRPWRFNLVTNYRFTEGRLNGFNVGGGYRWQDRVVIGFPLTANGESYDISNPYMGPSETNIDLWLGYERRLTHRVNWRIQLNVRNAFGSDDLIPVSVQSDTGMMAVARIPEPTIWTVTNTFRF